MKKPKWVKRLQRLWALADEVDTLTNHWDDSISELHREFEGELEDKANERDVEERLDTMQDNIEELEGEIDNSHRDIARLEDDHVDMIWSRATVARIDQIEHRIAELESRNAKG